ncbi:sigma 54-interacting transcriptional regulator [Enterococcus sp. AZ163]|uniref:sigma 54-interacting transcriptional regulator n=1 Tax=Enterococcus sp. AZ163 TaxID=2774638 RepID=UPI003D26FD24
MNRTEQVLAWIKKKSDQSKVSFTTLEISQALNMNRTAVSRELNKLVQNRQLKKVAGKPVLYILNMLSEESPLPKRIRKEEPSPTKKSSIFTEFIGTSESLKNQVNSAKAAIMYPPDGLHTILLGSTGVGKSTFAKVMYKYGQEIGKFRGKSPFVHVNCSDYSNNPQLLLSVLFGYVRGAFTGADTDKDGLIEEANNGLLFLDEVHRLPPEGQEMLFTIIDTQQYRKLGETSSQSHPVNVLIVCATTENIESSLLHTFKRRFQMVLKLPDLKDRTLQERIQLVDSFFCLESEKIEKEIFVEKQIVESLTRYNCPGNIGQLKNDIQILCAKEFAQAVIQGYDQIKISIDQLDRSLLPEIDIEDRGFFQDCTYYMGNKIMLNRRTKVELPIESTIDSSFYQKILEKYSTLLKEGKSIKEIQQKMTLFMNQRFNIQIDAVESREPLSNKGIEKLVSEEVLSIVNTTIQKISADLEVNCDQKVTYNLALHVEALVLKCNSGSRNFSKRKISEEAKQTAFHPYAQKLVKSINRKFQIKIPLEEQEIIELFLETIYKDTRKNPIGILIIMHGVGVATNLAKMVNDLLGIHHAEGLDMPLEDTIESVYEKSIDIVRRIDQGAGVLLLVDMGSLSTFSVRLKKELGINVRVVDNITSPLLIEATRKALFTNLEIESLVNELLEESTYFTSHRKNTTIFDYSSRRLIKNKDHLFYHSLEKSVTFLDIRRASEILDEILLSLSELLAFEIIDTLVIKFYFHCLAMIERSIRKENLAFELRSEDKDNYFYQIEKELQLLERIYGISLPESEILYVTKMVKTFV